MSGATAAHALRRAIRSLWENAALNAVSVLVIMTGLLLVGVAWTFQRNLDGLAASWGQDVHVSAYLKASLDEAATQSLTRSIEAMPEVQSVTYISQQEASAWLAGRVEGIGPVLDELGPSALPASLEITLKPEVLTGPEAVERFAQALPRDPIEDLDYGTGWVERFRAFLSLLHVLGGVVETLILASAGFIVLNTVHLIVYSRRDEVEIQKLVGGTPGFIIAPFSLEGLVQGLVGAAAAVVALNIGYELVMDRLRVALGAGADAGLSPLPASALVSLVLVGALLGLGASTLAAWRFLRRAP